MIWSSYCPSFMLLQLLQLCPMLLPNANDWRLKRWTTGPGKSQSVACCLESYHDKMINEKKSRLPNSSPSGKVYWGRRSNSTEAGFLVLKERSASSTPSPPCAHQLADDRHRQEGQVCKIHVFLQVVEGVAEVGREVLPTEAKFPTQCHHSLFSAKVSATSYCFTMRKISID